MTWSSSTTRIRALAISDMAPAQERTVEDVGRPEHSTALITSRFPIGPGRPSTTPEGDYRPRPGMPQGPGDERARPKAAIQGQEGVRVGEGAGHPNAKGNGGE